MLLVNSSCLILLNMKVFGPQGVMVKSSKSLTLEATSLKMSQNIRTSAKKKGVCVLNMIEVNVFPPT